MTVSSTTRKAGPFTGNGSQTAFPFSFKVFTKNDIAVTRANTSGVESVLVLDSDYTVSLNANQDASPGGTVNLTSGLTLNYKLSITGAMGYSQNTDLPTGGAYNAQNVEDALDRVVILTQQLEEQAVRALQVPVTSSMTADELVAELASGAATATAAASAASSSASAAATSETNAAASASAAQNYVGNIIQNPILGDDVFSGNGATTAFTLSRNMGTGNETALLVTISGVTQAPTAAYSVSGTTLTFTSAPPSGTSNIRVRYIGAMAVNAASAQTSATNAAASASAAATSASTASTAATNASTSASTASTAATNASTSASTASTAASNASSSASAAATSASNALTYSNAASSSMTSAANSASAAAGYLAPATSTSSTSVTIGTGSKSLTVETAKQWVAGMPIKIAVTASPSTNYMTGTVTSYNSGTGALVVDVTAVGGSGTYSAWSLSLPAGGGASLTTKLLRARYFASSGTYTPGADVAAFYVQVYGATGGVNGANKGGVGGPGYAEKYFATPAGPYGISIGAKGLNTGTNGGLTQFSGGGGISVFGSDGVTTTTGGAGGTAVGGDFNATGGTGGNYSGTAGGYGGAGGAGSRAGNGGTGGNGSASTPGAPGGTGSPSGNASLATPGTGATAASGSALVMPWGAETFAPGNPFNATGLGAFGAPLLSTSDMNLIGQPLQVTGWPTHPLIAPGYDAGAAPMPYPCAPSGGAPANGYPGLVVIIEVLK